MYENNNMGIENRPEIQPIEIDDSTSLSGEELNKLRITPTIDGSSQLQNYGAYCPVPLRNISDFEKVTEELEKLRLGNGYSAEAASESKLASVSSYSDATLNGRPDIQSKIIDSIRRRIAALNENPIRVRLARNQNETSNNH